MPPSGVERKACPAESKTRAPSATYQQQLLQQSHRNRQARGLQQERHSVLTTSSSPQPPVEELRPCEVSETHSSLLMQSPLQARGEQRLLDQEESAVGKCMQRPSTAGRHAEGRSVQPARANAGLTFKADAAASARLPKSEDTQVAPAVAPSSDNRLGNNTDAIPIDSTNDKGADGTAGTNKCRKSYRSSSGSSSSNTTTVSCGSASNSTVTASGKITNDDARSRPVGRVASADQATVKDCQKYLSQGAGTFNRHGGSSSGGVDAKGGSESRHCPPRVEASYHSRKDQSNSSLKDNREPTTRHQESREHLTNRGKSAAVSPASATKQEFAAGQSAVGRGRNGRCWSKVIKESPDIGRAGRASNTSRSHNTEADNSSCGGTEAPENPAQIELLQADEITTSSSVPPACVSKLDEDKSSRHDAVMCQTAADTSLRSTSQKNSQCAINIHTTPTSVRPAAHGKTTQHEPDTERSIRAEHQHHEHGLMLPGLKAATSRSLLALEKGKSRARLDTSLNSAGSRRPLQRHDKDTSSCVLTESSGKSGMFFRLKGAAAEGGSQARAHAGRVREGTGEAVPANHEEESTEGMSTRDAALSAAGALARRIRRHGWQRSASEAPPRVQGSSQRGGHAKQSVEEYEATAKENLTSHWFLREFFQHALNYPNKYTTKVKHREGTRAAAATREFCRQSSSCYAEYDKPDTSGEPPRTVEHVHDTEGHVSVDASVLPAAAHLAFSTATGSAAKQPASFQKTRSAETTLGASAAAAGHTAGGAYVLASGTGHTRKHVHDNSASGHSVTTAILHSAVQAVKSLPYRLHREWMYLIRPRKNSAHVNHMQRMQRAAAVQQDLSCAYAATAQRQKSFAVLGRTAKTSPFTAVHQGGSEAARGARASRASLQQLRYVDSMPAVAGRFFPKSQRERAKELQELLHMHQVLPNRETRLRLLQQMQRNIDKGRRDFELALPLLSLRREQLLPCGRTFVVRCLQQDSTSVTRIYRKYLTAGRLIGGGSEAMVFAAVETSLPKASPFNSRVNDLQTWRRPLTRNASQSLPSEYAPAPPVLTATLPGPATAAPSGTSDAHAQNRSLATPVWRAAEAARASGADAKGAHWPRRDGLDESKLMADGTKHRSEQGLQGAAPEWNKDYTGEHSRPLAGAAPPAGTKDEAGFIKDSVVVRERKGHECSRIAGEGQTLSSASNEKQEWATCWALKWFLCEPFLLRNRSKAEQEGTVVDWLQMALWRLVPSNSINADVIYELGIVAPQWIGFIEGVSLVCPGDERYALLNRVAALPLMLGDMLTVSPAGLTVGDRLYCVMRLIQIVANLHAMGVLHNDIKMENLLIGTDGTLHLGDLGSVTPFTGRPTHFQRIGTDVYLDPQTAQNFLECERREHDQLNQQLQDLPQTVKKGAKEGAQQQGATMRPEAAAGGKHTPAAGIETATHAPRLVQLGQGVVAKCKAAGMIAASSRDEEVRGAGGEKMSGVTECGDIEAAKHADARTSEGRSKEDSKTRTPFRTVYTPMRDAWAVGIVCYYVWCGGLLPFDLGQAFAGELKDHELFEYLARLPKLNKGNRAFFPLGSCPEGEAEEYVEVRRIIQGLLEPDGALRKTPLEIVHESFLFNAYKSKDLKKSKEVRP